MAVEGLLDKISGGVQGLAKGKIGIPGGVGGTIMFWFRTVFWVGVVVFVGLIIWKFVLQYNIRIRVLVRSGGKLVDIKHDRAKVVEDEQGKRKLVLWKMRKGKSQLTTPVPSQSYKYKCGRQDYYDLWLDDNFVLHPVEISEDLSEDEEGLLRPRPQERNAWSRMEADLINKKYESREKWREFILPVMFMGTLIICFLVLFFMFKELGAGLGDLAGAFAEVSRSCLR